MWSSWPAVGEGLASSPQAELSDSKACSPFPSAERVSGGQAGKGSGWVVKEEGHDE